MKRAVGIICAMALCMSEMQPVLAEDLPVVETESECAEKEETESNTNLTEVQDTEAVTQTETEANRKQRARWKAVKQLRSQSQRVKP